MRIVQEGEYEQIEATGRPAVALVATKNGDFYRYLVVFGDTELHGDDGARFGWT